MDDRFAKWLEADDEQTEELDPFQGEDDRDPDCVPRTEDAGFDAEVDIEIETEDPYDDQDLEEFFESPGAMPFTECKQS